MANATKNFAIGIENPKRHINIGTLMRSAVCFGASMCFVIGERYKNRSGDTVKSWRHIPFMVFKDWDDYIAHAIYDWIPIGVEIGKGSMDLAEFIHPKRAVYILGSEDRGLSKQAYDHVKACVEIPSMYCLNVAVAGSIVMYDRITKGG